MANSSKIKEYMHVNPDYVDFTILNTSKLNRKLTFKVIGVVDFSAMAFTS